MACRFPLTNVRGGGTLNLAQYSVQPTALEITVSGYPGLRVTIPIPFEKITLAPEDDYIVGTGTDGDVHFQALLCIDELREHIIRIDSVDYPDFYVEILDVPRMLTLINLLV
jgi:hypothetical protein